MNDYTIGVLEGLAYAKTILDKHFSEKDQGPVLDAYQELEEAQLKLLAGCAISFNDRLSLTKTDLPK